MLSTSSIIKAYLHFSHTNKTSTRKQQLYVHVGTSFYVNKFHTCIINIRTTLLFSQYLYKAMRHQNVKFRKINFLIQTTADKSIVSNQSSLFQISLSLEASSSLSVAWDEASSKLPYYIVPSMLEVRSSLDCEAESMSMIT